MQFRDLSASPPVGAINNRRFLKHEYEMVSIQDIQQLKIGDYDAVVLPVSHREFADIKLDNYKKSDAVVFDIKGILPVESVNGRL